MAVDLKFGKTTLPNGLIIQDVEVVSNDISIIKDEEEVDQNVRIRLQFYKGEWFLDIEAGIPYFEDILIKNPDIVEVDRIFKIAILDTPEIDRITEYSSTFDKRNRIFSVSFRASTIFGTEIEIQDEELVI